jgi:hypothetical protein
MPWENVLGISRIIRNGRVTLAKEVREKLSVKNGESYSIY